MNCQEALRLLYDIIDKEASDIDNQAVEQHLNKCRHCFDKFQLESSIQDLLKAKLSGGNPGPELANLKSKIMIKLDEVDNECQAQSRSPFQMAAWAIAAAASIVVVLGASNLVMSFIEHSADFMPFERAHITLEEGTGKTFDQVTTAAALTELRNDFEYELLLVVNDFELVSGGSEEIDGVAVRHFSYKNNGSMVSVFVLLASEYELPSSLDQAKITVSDRIMYDHNCRGCRLVYQEVGGSVVITATRDKSVELLEFVPGHRVI